MRLFCFGCFFWDVFLFLCDFCDGSGVGRYRPCVFCVLFALSSPNYFYPHAREGGHFADAEKIYGGLYETFGFPSAGLGRGGLLDCVSAAL